MIDDGAKKEAVREYQRRWREANRERLNEKARAWRAANPEKVKAAKDKYRAANREKELEAGRAYREANPEKVLESSRRWRRDNPERAKQVSAEYAARIQADEEKRLKRNAYMRKWSAENPERARAIATRSFDKNSKAIRLRNRALLDELKSKPCMDCGVQYPPYVMDFDHRVPSEKLFPIGPSSIGRTKESLEAEIAKCDLVCSNCHRERTHQQRLAGIIMGPPRKRPRVREADA